LCGWTGIGLKKSFLFIRWFYKIKDTRKGGLEGYVRIPEGSAEDHTQQISLHTTEPGAPKMKYKREGTIEENDRSCVLKSAASALSFLGYNRLAFNLCNDLENGRKNECGFEFFQNCIKAGETRKKKNSICQTEKCCE
jgi:hypothetical protein